MSWVGKAEDHASAHHTYEQGNDTHNYRAPVQLKYNGKTYDKFLTNVPVSHVGKNIITSFPAKACK
ncbi:hypothetical protein [Brevibacterium sp. UCMA 11754]|uniref:hypothetical protein n=1 Tax=Brevibacterium sp. UCMA 11754 TaxID=2749198 RepID=UPI001F170CD8|nr:hypothetical protein [Brevibacterium sp. UCMA 11754]MCF2571611.1 hypothetical protein [Brevibacterium sp. UCMA 11754]